MKRILALVFVFMVAFSVVASAETFPVQDDAGLLTNEQWQNLCDDVTSKIAKLDNKHGISVVTVDYLSGLSDDEIDKEAQYAFKKQNCGLGDDKSGVLLLVDASTNSVIVKIYKNGKANELITDNKAVSIERKVCDRIADGDAYGGIDRFVSESYNCLAEKNGSFAIWIAVGAVVALAVAVGGFIFVKRRK